MLANMNFALFAFAGGESGGLLDVNPGLIIWTAVIFVLLLLILRKIAWKPILNALDERESFIKDSLEKAEKAKEEAEKILEENKKNLANAEAEGQKVIIHSRKYAEELREQILADSRQEAKKILQDAQADIERKNQEAFDKLKGQVAEISIAAAEKILKENLDKDKQASLVNRFIDDIQKN